ncbi:TPA: hypothetical protein ACNAGS_004634, partial [Klebsiella pneumoniae]
KSSIYSTKPVSINNLPAALKRLDLPAEQVQVIEDYKKQFPFLIEDEENVLVSLDQLWEALDTPYYTRPGTASENPDGFDVAAKDKIRFNSLVKKIAGARNVKETDLDGYYLVQNMVSDLLKRGRTDKEILSVYFGDEAA